MESIGVSQFKARCIALLKQVQETGEGLLVTHRGQPLARIEPVLALPSRARLGALRHLGTVRGDLVNSDFADEWEMEQS